MSDGPSPSLVPDDTFTTCAERHRQHDELLSVKLSLLHLAVGLKQWSMNDRPLSIANVCALLPMVRTDPNAQALSGSYAATPEVVDAVFHSFEQILLHCGDEYSCSSSASFEAQLHDFVTYSRYVVFLLQCALIYGITDVAQLFAEHDINIHLADDENRTALTWACGSVVDYEREQYNAGLIFPVREGNVALIHLLLNAQADVNHVDCCGVSCLMWACLVNHIGTVHTLITAGAKVTYEHKWTDTALNVAARHGSIDAARMLIAAGANIHHRDFYSRAPVVNAVENGHLEMMQMLLESGAVFPEKTHDNRTMLMSAALGGNLEIIRMFSQKEDLEIQDSSGQTALMLVSRRNHPEVTRALVDAAADVNTRDLGQRTALMWAASFGNSAQVRVLLELRADVHARNRMGRTALMATSNSCGKNAASVIQLLVDAGANVEEVDNQGKTVLLCALEDRMTIGNVIPLLRANARVDVQYKRKTPLMLVFENDLHRVLKPLLEAAKEQLG